MIATNKLYQITRQVTITDESVPYSIAFDIIVEHAEEVVISLLENTLVFCRHGAIVCLIKQSVDALLLQRRLKYLGSLVEVASLHESEGKNIVRLQRIAELLGQLIKLAYYLVVHLHGSLRVMQIEHAGR